VILDEFHERSLQADLALALLLDVQQGLRDDLKLLIMSATLDNERLQQLLPDAPVIISEGRAFPLSAAISRWRRISVLTKRSRLRRRSCCAGKRVAAAVFAGRRGNPARAGTAGKRVGGDVVLCPLYGALPLASSASDFPAPQGSAKWCWRPILPKPA
jgi:ATP-dependent helicase HrpB